MPLLRVVMAERWEGSAAFQLDLIMVSFGSRGSRGDFWFMHARLIALSPWNPTIPTAAAAAGQTGWELTRNTYCQIPPHDNHCVGQANLIKWEKKRQAISEKGGGGLLWLP